ncbi:hypothetical protein XELAEV_18043466mg [Xenopus laevis]|uniref:Uncharacterized protein n=1 Tax=Xenopus laevis TaxID=8355 RepID=A0A974BXL1_XENLA|nr:hypothetical protein XELAEV_18043466mg [Xenopus laevis]
MSLAHTFTALAHPFMTSASPLMSLVQEERWPPYVPVSCCASHEYSDAKKFKPCLKIIGLKGPNFDAMRIAICTVYLYIRSHLLFPKVQMEKRAPWCSLTEHLCPGERCQFPDSKSFSLHHINMKLMYR